MEHATSPPAGHDARIAFIAKLPADLMRRTAGMGVYAKRPLFFRKRNGKRRLQWLRPLVMHEPAITLDGKDRPLYYPTLLLTKHNTFVRGVLHGRRVHYSAIAASELTDAEVRNLTRAIRGESGLQDAEYLRIARLGAVESLKDTS
ncbi:hypothetical protein KI440_02820 [Candidatus Saccharibacteria bacterium TM7i]|nr:hypothetical protein KI440_02820 [Candidatus Saccharibacteria bacterium TM7i]